MLSVVFKYYYAVSSQSSPASFYLFASPIQYRPRNMKTYVDDLVVYQWVHQNGAATSLNEAYDADQTFQRLIFTLYSAFLKHLFQSF